MTTKFYNFTGTNGAGPPTDWTAYTAGAGAAATIQYNAMQLLAGPVGGFGSV